MILAPFSIAIVFAAIVPGKRSILPPFAQSSAINLFLERPTKQATSSILKFFKLLITNLSCSLVSRKPTPGSRQILSFEMPYSLASASLFSKKIYMFLQCPLNIITIPQSLLLATSNIFLSSNPVTSFIILAPI